MNKKKIILGVVLVLTLTSLGVYLLFFHNRIDTNLATMATLYFLERDGTTGIFTNHKFLIVDDEDITVLRKILRGRTTRDSPSCGFSINIAITMYGRGENITFCLALDGCPIIRVNDSDRFISISYSQRASLDDIFSRFGFVFPAV